MNLLLILFVSLLWPEPDIPTQVHIDRIIVNKAARSMVVYQKGKVVKTYKISLGRNPIGDKKVEGDMKTPEGLYHINDKNPNSTCHKNLGISYPNEADKLEARKLSKPPGGAIKIHGLLNGWGYLGRAHLLSDWTWGCIAVTDDEIDELYEHVPVGTPIEIKP